MHIDFCILTSYMLARLLKHVFMWYSVILTMIHVTSMPVLGSCHESKREVTNYHFHSQDILLRSAATFAVTDCLLLILLQHTRRYRISHLSINDRPSQIFRRFHSPFFYQEDVECKQPDRPGIPYFVGHHWLSSRLMKLKQTNLHMSEVKRRCERFENIRVQVR